MTRQQLIEQINRKESLLCVGLDTDIKKIPGPVLRNNDPVFEFNKQIIDATIDYAVAYKPNLAFYEALGSRGWESLEKTVEYLPDDVFVIADAKRGDIGNTSNLYAKAFFEKMNFDAITIAPYMGKDSVTPFLKFEDKWVILLALTSNEGSADFQIQKIDKSEHRLFEEVLLKGAEWATRDELMFVVGATKADHLVKIRTLVPDYFLLIPGVGAQGGSLDEVCKNGLNQDFGLLINSSRGIIYSSAESDFAFAAKKAAAQLQGEMKQCLDKYM
ncbi:MAG: orotidine-5'-phosphate decarboxylase [Bacteroidetes bacterium]|nr:orotidine-5'-phosphate decarboxylase [Bacteroidota bacterium]MDA1121050.1 orotidine-5'-phosphate decarboxylase [Bacteroidota bacterium]